MDKRVAGICHFIADGKQFSLGGSFSFSPETISREAVTGLSGQVFFKETPVAPFMEGEVIVTSETDLQEISKMTGVTVTGEFANGHTWTLTDAFKVGVSEISGGDGTTSIRFEGEKCERVS